jgi:23S rRNA pseudouridine955/2504/2580 synthase
MITNAVPLRHIEDPTHGSVTLVEVELVTGRPHQIRAHLAYAGYPVVGDTKYGDKKVNDYYASRFGLSTQFLHAHKLVIKEGHETLAYLSETEIISPLPEKLQSIIEV